MREMARANRAFMGRASATWSRRWASARSSTSAPASPPAPTSTRSHPTLTRTLDLRQPVAAVLVGVLMYFRDSDDPSPFEMVATIMEAVPSGSYLAITHPTPDFNPEETAKAAGAAEAAGITLVPRTKAEVERFFTGLELVDPGMAPMLAWRPAGPPADPQAAYYWAGVARKP